MRLAATVLCMLLFSSPLWAAVQGQNLQYQIDGQNYQGYIAKDDSLRGPLPAVIVVHEWWGHNAYARQRANMLAAQGYVAMALDMYGAGKLASHPEDAKSFMMAVMEEQGAVQERFLAAKELLADRPDVKADRIAAIGYCFGGGVALNMARAGVDLAGIVSFHGSLNPQEDTQPGDIVTPIMVFNGESDPFVPADAVAAFKQEMQQAKADMVYVGYAKAKHSFTSPTATATGEKFGLPLEYNQAADEDSWRQASSFLREVLTR